MLPQMMLLLQLGSAGASARVVYDDKGHSVLDFHAGFVQTERHAGARRATRCSALLKRPAGSRADLPGGSSEANHTTTVARAGCELLWFNEPEGVTSSGVEGYQSRSAMARLGALKFWLDSLPGSGRDSTVLQLVAWQSSELASLAVAAQSDPRYPVLPIQERASIQDVLARVENVMRERMRVGEKPPDAFRACTSIALALADPDAAHDCSIRALAAGRDSTWHALRLTWLAYLRGDASFGNSYFTTAITTARTRSERAELGWHMEPPHDPLWYRMEEPNVAAARAVADAEWDATAREKQTWFELPQAELLPWLHARVASVDGARRWQATDRMAERHFGTITPSGGSFRPCVAADRALPCGPANFEDDERRVVAERYRLWNAAEAGACLFLMRRPGADAEPWGSEDSIVVRQWDPAQRQVTESMAQPSGNGAPYPSPAAVATFTVPCAAAQTSWSVAYSGRHTPRPLRGFSESSIVAEQGGLALSDLMVSASEEILIPVGFTVAVPAGMGGTLKRAAPVKLFYQVRSDRARGDVVSELSIVPIVKGKASGEPAMRVASRGRLEAGIGVVERTVDVRKLKTGAYHLLIRLTDAATQETQLSMRQIEVR